MKREFAKEARARVTNGRTLWLDKAIDGRSIRARRFRDIRDALLRSITDPTELQKSLARRAATLGVLAEVMEGELASGQPMDTALYVSIAKSQRNLFEILYLENAVRPPGASLDDYIRHSGHDDG